MSNGLPAEHGSRRLVTHLISDVFALASAHHIWQTTPALDADALISYTAHLTDITTELRDAIASEAAAIASASTLDPTDITGDPGGTS